MPEVILLVGPATALRQLRESCLSEPPFELRTLVDVVQATALIRRESPSAVVYIANCHDGETMLGTCAELRQLGSFPLMIMAEASPVEMAPPVLEAGADDYVAIDISPRELRARLRAHLRRANYFSQLQQAVVHVGSVEIDRDHRQVCLGETRMTLPPKEFALLEYMLLNSERVVRRDEILEKVWELPAGLRSRTLDVHVSRLRQKMGQSALPLDISTVPGVGYRLVLGGGSDGELQG
jgi:DNA-binding response OmpR family regulator